MPKNPFSAVAHGITKGAETFVNIVDTTASAAYTVATTPVRILRNPAAAAGVVVGGLVVASEAASKFWKGCQLKDHSECKQDAVFSNGYEISHHIVISQSSDEKPPESVYDTVADCIGSEGVTPFNEVVRALSPLANISVSHCAPLHSPTIPFASHHMVTWSAFFEQGKCLPADSVASLQHIMNNVVMACKPPSDLSPAFYGGLAAGAAVMIMAAAGGGYCYRKRSRATDPESSTEASFSTPSAEESSSFRSRVNSESSSQSRSLGSSS